ncbi:MAG: histidinol-phosphate transaminase [Nitrospinota bacterium]|nr:histidinol-phosphate transaminase [Nitrospinota bacterium]
MSKVDLIQLVKEKVQSLKAYHVENVDCEIKLHANENSFPPPPEILKQFEEAFKSTELNRYPDPDCSALKQTLSRRLNVTPENLAIGNGSDELIQILLQIFCDPGEIVGFPDPTFAMYAIIAQGMGLKSQTHPLDEQWDFKAEPFLETLNTSQAKIAFISYPNNPTGNCFSAGEVQKVIENFSGIVVLDEAYHDFARKSFISELPRHNNLIILRSLSKIGLAALRVGYAVADPLIINQIDKIRLPYNSNTLSQVLTERLLNHFEPVQKQLDALLQERDRMILELSKFGSLTVFPSDANFVLFRVEKDASAVFRQLMDRGILVRDLSRHPRLKNCLRVTIGTPEENQSFLEQIANIIK